MMMSSNSGSDPVVGVFNQSSRGVDYSPYGNAGYPITGIRVEWNPIAIVSLQFAYNQDARDAIKGTAAPTMDEIYDLDNGDFIEEIFLLYISILML